MELLAPKSLKIIKTCVLYLSFFFLGMSVAVPGPCLMDLQHIVQTDIEHITFIYTAKSLGYLFGSLLGGIIIDMLKNKLWALSVCSLIASISMLGIPWSRSLGVLTAFMAINGATAGSVDTCGNVYCLNLWGKESGPFYQALHFVFGLGCLVAPLIAAPFLSDFSNVSANFSDNNTFSNESFNSSILINDSLINQDSQSFDFPTVTYPFTIIGAFGVLVAVLFFVIIFVSPNEDLKKQREVNEPRKKSLAFLSLLIVLCALLLFVETGTEIGFAQMLTSYAVKGSLKLSANIGSYMTSAFWTSFTLSRLASIFLASKFSNLTLLVYDIIVTSIGALLLLILTNHEWALWLSSVLLGNGIASFFPATVGWLDTYINVTNKIASLLVLGAAFGEMLIPFTISYYIEQIPEVLVYVVVASCLFSGIIMFLIYLILRKETPKFVANSSTNPDNSISVIS